MFEIQANNQKITISVKQLAELLIAKSIDEKSDKVNDTIPVLADALAKIMQQQNLLHTSTPLSIMSLGISIGYYLNTFFRKNKVTIQKNDQTTAHVNSESPND